jgi:predicted nucleic acid-binding protein
MRKLRIYVDTSVFGGVQDKEFYSVSRKFFNMIKRRNYCILVSDVTLAELSRAPAVVRKVYEDLPVECVEEVSIDDEVNHLAQAYIDAGILGSARRADAAHVAAATIARADLIVSWNFKHIVNYNCIRKFNGVNALHGYPSLEIHSPMEIRDEEDNENI